MTSVVWERWKNGGKKGRKANSPTFENNQTSLPMQLKKQPFEKLLHLPRFPAPLSGLFQKDPCHPPF
jgi:hypothetical protein